MDTLTKERFALQTLPYATDALEPYIDQKTMEIHYQKHHGGYVNNLNDALAKAGVNNMITIEEIFKNVTHYSKAVRNNAGGHYNHALFWSILTPNSDKIPQDEIAVAINKKFGSFDEFKKQFEKEALSRFGSGWAWLVSEDGNLKIGSTSNQDNPLMETSEFKGAPIFGVDLWEHAYYLKYQNKRAEYLTNIWNIINWEEVNKRYKEALEE